MQKLPVDEHIILVGRSELDEDIESAWHHGRPTMREAMLGQVREIQKLYARSELTLYTLYEENTRLRTELSHMRAELRTLSKQSEPVMTVAEQTYAKLRPQLEDLRGKYVAIDTESQKVVGVGDSLAEARKDAMAKTGRKQFYFRRVGQRYLFRI